MAAAVESLIPDQTQDGREQSRQGFGRGIPKPSSPLQLAEFAVGKWQNLRSGMAIAGRSGIKKAGHVEH